MLFAQDRVASCIPNPIIHFARIIGQDQVQEDTNDGGNDEGCLNDQINTLLEPSQVNVRATVVEDLAKPIWLNDVHETDTQAVDLLAESFVINGCEIERLTWQ